MAQLDRIVFGGLGIGLVAAALSGLHQEVGGVALAAEPVAKQRESLGRDRVGISPADPKATAELDADLAAFVRDLERFRRGDEGALVPLGGIAERLCRNFRRCDARDVLAHYASLSAADRARGVEREGRFLELWKQVQDARREGLDAGSWPAVRDRIVEDLQVLAGAALLEPDLAPGARALGLAARLSAERIESDPTLDADQRDELLAEAASDARAAIAAFERIGMVTPRIEPLWVLARLDRSRGDPVAARDGYEECFALARRLRQPTWQENALRGIIEIADENGDRAEVARLLNELASFRTPDECWFLAEKQGGLMLARDDARAAAEFLAARQPVEPGDRRRWHLLLGSAYLRAGDLDRAREEYAAERAVPWEPDVTLAMASIDLKAGRADRVVEQVAGLAAAQDLPPLRRAQALQILGEAELRMGRTAEAARSLARALELGRSLQARLSLETEGSDGITNVLGERIGLHALALYAEAQAHLGDGLEAARAIEDGQLPWMRRSADAGLDRDDLRVWAKAFDLGLVTWVVGADSSVVAHVAPDGGALAAVIPHGRRAIDAAVRRVREAATAGDGAAVSRLMGEVKAAVLPPRIAQRIASLQGSNARSLLFLLHGPLERLPVELLETDAPLVAVCLPGLPEHSPGAPVSSGDLVRWRIVGGPVDASGRSLLPGARDELASIAGLLREREESAPGGPDVLAGGADDTTLRVGSRFDRAALAEALADRAPLHVATHLSHGCGSAAGQFADVGLVLSAGDVFCAREILAARPRLPLAVLSACETGEGRFVDAEGLQGIARAFLESGTRNLVVTLWPVEDRAAREFAVELHRALLAGALPSAAAAQARAALRAGGFSVAEWAAFRLLGRD